MTTQVQCIQSCIIGVPSEDKEMLWEITNKCDLNCLHCCNAHRRNHSDISPDTATTIIDDLVNHSITKITFTGGEPLLYNGFFHVASYAKEKGFKVVICTNGELLEEFSYELTSLNPNKIVIGVEGFSEVHDRFRGKEGLLNKILKGVDCMENSGVHLSFHYTVNRHNLEDISRIVSYARERNIGLKLSNLVLIKQKPEISKYMISEEKGFRGMMKDIDASVETKFIRAEKGLLEKCPAGERTFGILSDGKYTPCLWLSNFTSEFNTCSLDEVLNLSRNLDRFFDSCGDKCSFSHCGRGCPAVALSMGKKRDPLCPYEE